MLPDRPLLIDFNGNAVLMQRFGLDVNLLNKLENDKKIALKKLFDDLQYLIDVIGEKESTYALMNWADVFFAEQALNAEEFFTVAHRRANAVARHADNTMSMVYLGMNALGFILSVLALPGINVNTNAIAAGSTATGMGSGWNYIDTCGGIIVGVKQILQGEVGMGMANLVSSLQLAGGTIAADIGTWCSASVHLSSATICGLTGFSFAAGMFISGALEFYEVYKAEERIKHLESQQAQIARNTSDPVAQDKIIALQKAIYIEKAQRANHLRSAKSWMACGVAMTLIAVVGYVALSGATFGALPIVTALFTGAALITALARRWWVSHVDHMANMKASLIKSEQSDCSLFDRLQQHMNDPQFSAELKVPGISLFRDIKVKFKDYLQNMLLENPKKLASILTAYEQRHNIEDMRPALKQHRKVKIIGGFGETMGEKIHAMMLASKPMLRKGG